MTNTANSPRIPPVTYATLLAAMFIIMPAHVLAQTAAATYRSPWDVDYSPDGKSVAVSDATAGELVILSAADGSVQKTVKLNGQPRGVVWSGGSVLVAEYNAGTVAVVDPATGQVTKRLNVGPKPAEVGVAATKKLVAVTDYGLGKVYVVNQDTGAQVGSVAVASYPFALDVTPNGSLAVVGHLTPTGDATKPDFAAGVSIVSLESPKLVTALALPQGSTSVRGVKCSPDGKWAYVTHLLGRVTLPTTHVLRAWINSDALSIIDLSSNSVYATVLLDRISEGAADPWGMAISADGKTLWVSISGAHQVISVDLTLLHQLMAGTIPSEIGSSSKMPDVFNRSKSAYKRPLSDIWFDIARDPKKRAFLQDDLGALWGAGILKITRFGAAEGQGPRGIALATGGKQLAVATYFAGKVSFIDADTGKVARSAPVGTQPAETAVRQGERTFFDASTTLQHWLSCNTCHPETRADGLNWDLLNDGAGNPKNTKSMVYSWFTPPAMAHGVRASAAVAIAAGFKYIKFVVPSEDQLNVVAKYLESLRAEIDPYRINGEMTDDAKKGKDIFAKAGCAACHNGPFFTDLKLYDVGTKHPGDTSGEFDNPTLLEMWRTAPYLHDGSAATIKDVLTTANKADKHGKTSQLTPAEIDQLAAYVLQLGPTEVVSSSDGGVETQTTTDTKIRTDTKTTTDTGTRTDTATPSASAGCACHVGGPSTQTSRASIGLVGLALFLLARCRRREATPAGTTAIGTSAAATHGAQAAIVDFKAPHSQQRHTTTLGTSTIASIRQGCRQRVTPRFESDPG